MNRCNLLYDRKQRFVHRRGSGRAHTSNASLSARQAAGSASARLFSTPVPRPLRLLLPQAATPARLPLLHKVYSTRCYTRIRSARSIDKSRRRGQGPQIWTGTAVTSTGRQRPCDGVRYVEAWAAGVCRILRILEVFQRENHRRMRVCFWIRCKNIPAHARMCLGFVQKHAARHEELLVSFLHVARDGGRPVYAGPMAFLLSHNRETQASTSS